MNKSFNPIPQEGNEQDLSKRLIRSIADTVRALDDARGRAKGVFDLFLPAVQVLRSKLHELCNRLMLLDPLTHGKRGEEILWRKGYHDVLTTARTFKQGEVWSESDGALVVGLLLSGVGYYYHLLLKLQADYALEIILSVDFPLFVDDHGLPKDKSGPGKHDEPAWALPFAARLLICLGDLVRYLSEVEPGWDVGFASRLYYQSACLAPTLGRPHNQLGTLASGRNYCLDAVYHYLRSLNCSEPFPGALGNLYKVLERNVATRDTSGPAHKVINRLLHTVDSWYCDKDVDDFPVVCLELVEGFQQSLSINQASTMLQDVDWERPFAINDAANHLSISNSIKVLAVLLICYEKLRKADSPRLCEVQSVLLAMSNHLIGLLAGRWKSRGAARRRRRRRLSAGSADSESSGSVSGGLSSAGESETSDEETHRSNDAEASLANGVLLKTSHPTTEEELLQPLYIVFCWFHNLPELWYIWPEPTKVAQRNFLTILNCLSELCIEGEASAIKQVPLPEDVALRGLSPLKSVQSNIDWSIRAGVAEECKARVHRIIDMGRQLPGFNLDDQLLRFTLIRADAASGQKKCKGDLMKHMGQLWLKEEVRALESRTSGPRGASPFLVIDAYALVDHIVCVKQILGSRQFILVIPAVVLSTVDEWKHESGRSREAIRWLETQFLRGNRSLRSQKAHEKLPFSLIKYPKKKDKDAWNSFQILECCHFLRKQSSLLVTLITGSRSPVLTSEAAALASSFGINVEGIEAFYTKWKDSKPQGKNKE